MAATNFYRRPQRTGAASITTNAPYKGLNTVDALSAMDPAYGLQIENFIVTPQGLSMRQGYARWATGFSTTPTSLLSYGSTSPAANRMFAVSSGSIYDITSAGAIGAPVVTGLTAAHPYWQSATQTFSTSGTNFMMIVNGTDAPRLYNGTTWTTCTQTASPSAPGQWKNTDTNSNAVNISDFADVTLHQQRLWFVAVNSTKAYYADIAAVGGNLTPMDFGPLFPRGGQLHKLATWTMDLGSSAGTQALLVAISSKGDVVLFQGTNPAVSTSWGLMGVFQLGSPIGRRCTAAFQGDLLYLSQDGLYPMSKYIQSGRVDAAASLTYTIAPTISELVTTYGSTPGFELLVAPAQNLLILNAPAALQESNVQFVFHTITKGWSKFSGWPAQCFGIFNDRVYFGGTDFVGYAFQGWVDGADMLGVGGTTIAATAMTAFNYFSEVPGFGPGVLKHVKAVKPLITTDVSQPTVKVGVNTDFNMTPIVGIATPSAPAGASWDAAGWDAVPAIWGAAGITYNQWATPLSYPGDALALVISVSATGRALWTTTSWLIEPGGGFG